ncbi:MAG: hypothetical protein QNJ97_07830 [Myxococcota bacterium]|nr:hypothetical protein [Myxococcota bacterium]
MTQTNKPAPEMLCRLELWAERLIRIAKEEASCRCDLADLGVIAKDAVPDIHPHDPPLVIRLKERLLLLSRQRRTTHNDMAAVGAQMLDEQTMEIILPGGPYPGSYLSWQPGETDIAWWRSDKDLNAQRRILPGLAPEDAMPVRH